MCVCLVCVSLFQVQHCRLSEDTWEVVCWVSSKVVYLVDHSWVKSVKKNKNKQVVPNTSGGLEWNLDEIQENIWKMYHPLTPLLYFQVPLNFYRAAIESILAGDITVWHGSRTAQYRKLLQQVIKTASKNIGEMRCLRRSQRKLRDNTYLSHSLFILLLSGKRYRSIRCQTTRPQSSFILQAVRLLNLFSAAPISLVV